MLSPLKRTIFYTALLGSLTLAVAFAETIYPLTVTDDFGNSLTLHAEPKTISSKTLFSDELLLGLLENERLSSITHIASDESFSNVADKITPDLEQLDLNVESILVNSPDLLIAANWSDTTKVQQLKAIGIPVYLIKTPFTLEDIQEKIRTIGYLLNITDKTDALLVGMNQQLDELKEQRAAIAQQQWVALDYNSWGTANGKNTTWQTVLDNAGLINGAATLEAGAFGQVALSKELIVAINPDILFLPGWIYSESQSAEAFYSQVVSDPALSDVKAIVNNRVYAVPENLRGTYSQYIVETIRFVVDSLYPETGS